MARDGGANAAGRDRSAAPGHELPGSCTSANRSSPETSHRRRRALGRREAARGVEQTGDSFSEASLPEQEETRDAATVRSPALCSSALRSSALRTPYPRELHEPDSTTSQKVGTFVKWDCLTLRRSGPSRVGTIQLRKGRDLREVRRSHPLEGPDLGRARRPYLPTVRTFAERGALTAASSGPSRSRICIPTRNSASVAPSSPPLRPGDLGEVPTGSPEGGIRRRTSCWVRL